MSVTYTNSRKKNFSQFPIKRREDLKENLREERKVQIQKNIMSSKEMNQLKTVSTSFALCEMRCKDQIKKKVPLELVSTL